VPSETRFFTSKLIDVNLLTGRHLDLTKKTVEEVGTARWTGVYATTGQIGIRVFKRDTTGAMTEITTGLPPVALADVTTTKALVSGTWNCPETPLATTDTIVVEVWGRVGTEPWSFVGAFRFTTEQLGATVLNSATWTVHYAAEIRISGDPWVGFDTDMLFYYDGDEESRIDNFTWGVPPPPIIIGALFRWWWHRMEGV